VTCIKTKTILDTKELHYKRYTIKCKYHDLKDCRINMKFMKGKSQSSKKDSKDRQAFLNKRIKEQNAQISF